MSEVEVERKIARDFLLELNVCRIDSRVSIILTKHAHGGSERNAPRRRHGLYAGPGGRFGRGAKARKGKAGVTEYAELLYSVVGNRSDLSQHVLPTIINAVAGSQHRPARLRDVPGKAHTRLEFLLRTVQGAVGRKSGIS